jgi:hypothetical protein
MSQAVPVMTVRDEGDIFDSLVPTFPDLSLHIAATQVQSSQLRDFTHLDGFFSPP